MRRAERIAEVAKRDAEERLRKSHPRPPPLRPQYITAPPQLSQLAPAMAHSPAPPAASAPLDSPIASAASAPFTTFYLPAASGESRVSSAALHSCIRGRHLQQVRGCLPDGYWDNAVPPRKEVNTKMNGNEAENNLLARKSLSQCRKDPLFSCEVYPATTGAYIVVRKRGQTRTLSCSLARYNRQTTSVALCIS